MCHGTNKSMSEAEWEWWRIECGRDWIAVSEGDQNIEAEGITEGEVEAGAERNAEESQDVGAEDEVEREVEGVPLTAVVILLCRHWQLQLQLLLPLLFLLL